MHKKRPSRCLHTCNSDSMNTASAKIRDDVDHPLVAIQLRQIYFQITDPLYFVWMYNRLSGNNPQEMRFCPDRRRSSLSWRWSTVNPVSSIRRKPQPSSNESIAWSRLSLIEPAPGTSS